jgi:hypothetical protein
VRLSAKSSPPPSTIEKSIAPQATYKDHDTCFCLLRWAPGREYRFLKFGIELFFCDFDQMPSPRNPHGEHPSSHFADANSRINCEQLQPTGAFVAIASKTRSDDERLIWRFLDLSDGLSVLSVAQEFSCSYPLFVVRER